MSKFKSLTSLRIFAALFALLVLSGCTRLQVKFGRKIYLEKTPVASIKVSLPKGPGIAPGEKSPLVVVLTQPDGKILQTEGEGHGKVLWKDITVTATVVTVNQKGVLVLPPDPRVSDGKIAHVSVTVPSHPEFRSELDVPVRYDTKFAANFSGVSGPSGFNGSDGVSGINGTPGSIDLNNPSAGGNGTNGTDGSNGGDGGSGGDGPPVQVRVALREGSHPLLQIVVSAQGGQEFYLVDPQGGSLIVSSSGGSGGSGGKGGKGGRGGSGGSGTPNGSNGRDGSDGRDGSSGSSGRGGSITVIYDPAAQPFLNVIHLWNVGGPQPVFREELVAPLW
jgi:hypothetical protein